MAERERDKEGEETARHSAGWVQASELKEGRFDISVCATDR